MRSVTISLFYTTLAFILISLPYNNVHGFTAGAPPLRSVCRDMVPQHHEYKPQTVPGPYRISTNTIDVVGGSNIKVYINSTDATKVRGFYIQARDSETNMPIGSFIMNENAGTHSCFGKRWSAATHNNGHILKDFVEIEWTAPADYEGEVVVLGTVLKDFVTFWSGIYSDPITITKKPAPSNTRNRIREYRPSSLTLAVQNIFQEFFNVLRRNRNRV